MFCALCDLLCSKLLVFETTNESDYVDLEGQVEGHIEIF